MEDIYSMCGEEIDLHLKLCELSAGGEASLPPYLRRLTGKHVSGIIRSQIITSQVRNMEYYGSHRVPLPATLLNTIKTRNYISKELDLTYRTAKKGLTLLGVALLDEDEIPSINELHKYITSASLRSHEEINNLKAPKLHGKFHGAAQGDCKLALCAFHCILPPLSQTK